MMMFSATYKTPIIDFATKIFMKVMIIRLRRRVTFADESHSQIKQFYVQCSSQVKLIFKKRSLSHSIFVPVLYFARRVKLLMT